MFKVCQATFYRHHNIQALYFLHADGVDVGDVAQQVKV